MSLSSSPLLTLPTVAARLLSLTADPNTCVSEIGKAIRLDPSLTGKVLKAVNSVQYSVGRPIADVDRAVILLGKRTVSTLALTFSLSDAVSRNKRLTKYFQQYWTESIVQAITAEILALAHCPGDAGMYFSAALLQDLGRLYLLQNYGDDYAMLIEVARQGNKHLIDLEREAFETTHPDLTANILAHWQFPQQVVFAIAAHHRFQQPAPDSPTAFTLDRALHIAALVGEYFCQTNKGVVHVILEETLARCPGTKMRVSELTDQVHGRLAAMADLFNIHTADLPSANEMLCEAMQQIAMLAISLEEENSSQTARVDLIRENSMLRQRLQEVMQQIRIDPVTGVFTREVLSDRLNKMIQIAARQHGSVGLLFVDIDHFKGINDVYGHVAGDKVLRHVAQAIGSCVRGNDFTARFGGEEFVVVIDKPDMYKLQTVAERVRSAIESHNFVLDRKEASVTASVGAALLAPVVDTMGTAELLISTADAAMYEAKRLGRNQVVVSKIDEHAGGMRPVIPPNSARVCTSNDAPVAAALH